MSAFMRPLKCTRFFISDIHPVGAWYGKRQAHIFIKISNQILEAVSLRILFAERTIGSEAPDA